jgi:hypothetical protein
MRTYFDCTDATASGDTVETKIGTITLSAKAKRIIGVWAYACAGATMTIAEVQTGICRLDSSDISLAPFKFPLDQITLLTSGAVALPTHIIPVSVPVVGMAKVDAFVTMDMAQTGALKCRVGILYEGD